MNTSSKFSKDQTILLAGHGRSLASIAACVVSSDPSLVIVTEHPSDVKITVNQHLTDLHQYAGKEKQTSFRITQDWPDDYSPTIAILTGYTDPATVIPLIQKLEIQSNNVIIAVATDHIPLHILQKDTARPENIVVVNWAEPAHTTFFLEIVHNEVSNPDIIDQLKAMGMEQWAKDPYTVHAELGIRGRMNTAMLREALFLVEEGYANIEDIDRACRNDAGTYLPFSGHFQYMDLMGTYAYGVVMEKLNKELSNATVPPAFFTDVLQNNAPGMQGGKGFYDYSEKEVEVWEEKMRKFSFEIKKLMETYF